MASRVNVHARGYSGCRPEITLTLVEMLNKGVTPVVCQKGSSSMWVKAARKTAERADGKDGQRRGRSEGERQ
jgi:hypothetical protein